MFFGAVPVDCIEQIVKIVPFREWPAAYVCCSGSFRIEKALSAGFPDLTIRSNDVALYSAVIGTLATGGSMRVDFKGEMEYVEEILAARNGAFLDRAAAVLVTCEVARYRGKTLWATKRRAWYRDHFVEMLDKAAAKLSKTKAGIRIASYAGKDWREHVDDAIAEGAGVAAFPPFFCLAPSHRLLTADLRWIPCGDLAAGERLLAFEEEPAPGNRCRRWRRAEIVHSALAIRECVRVVLANGDEIICTADHPWLSDESDNAGGGSRRSWVRADRLMRWGKRENPVCVLKALETWEPALSFEAGWLSGMLDGEGSFVLGNAPKLGIAQNPGHTSDRFIAAMRGHGFEVDLWGPNKAKTHLIRGGLTEHMKALGTLRPQRLLHKLDELDLEALSTRSRGSPRIKVLAVEPVGLREVQVISTTSRTYIGDGYLMHNCGDYESQYKFVEACTDWDRPTYDIYNPKSLGAIVDRIDASGIPYCVLSDQELPGRTPVMEYVTGRKVPHLCYARTTDSSVRHLFRAPEPFRYQPFDIKRAKPDSRLRITEAPAQHVDFIKDVYLAKTIRHTPGMWSFFVWVDDMLAGALVYRLDKYSIPGKNALYLLSDVTTSRDAKVSKLVALIATSRSLVDVINRRSIDRFDYVLTTARTRHPVSMKYRGIFELRNRRPSDDPDEGNILNYGSDLRTESPQQLYGWWWGKFGAKAHAAAHGNPKGKPAQLKAPGAKRPLHDRAADEAAGREHPT